MRLRFKIVFTAAIICLAVVSILAGLSLLKLRQGVEMRKQASAAQGTLDDVLESLQQAHIYHLKSKLTGSIEEEALVAQETQRAQESFVALTRNEAVRAPEIVRPLARLQRLIETQISNASYHGMDAPLSNEIRHQIEEVDGLLEQKVNAHQLFVDKYFNFNVGTLVLTLLFALALLFAFVISVNEEIRRRTRLEQELRMAQAAAVSASNLKSQFVATVSHEIRTPLNGIIGMSELVRDLVQGPELRRYAEIIHNSGQSLLRIVNDILDFSKIEANRFEFEMEEVRPAQIIESAVELFARRAGEKKLWVVGDYEPGFNDIFATDGSRLAQVLHNLLGNAIKFTERGGVQIRGKIQRSEEDSVSLQFDIVDSGCGFSSADRSLLFQPFNQLSNARNKDGTGLGLTICKRLVENMGGQIGVSSELGKGSHFWFRVPVQYLRPRTALAVGTPDGKVRGVGVGLPPQIGQFLESNRALMPLAFEGNSHWPADFLIHDVVFVRESMAMVTPLTPTGPRIIRLPEQITPERLQRTLQTALQTPLAKPALVAASFVGEKDLLLLVEDNTTNQILAHAMLEGMGYRVHVAGNGQEGLEALRRVNYALVLMDCRMPVMDGFTATRHIRDLELQEGRPRIPIIAMTANAGEADREKCLAAGMDDYVTKPFEPTRLAEMVRHWAKGTVPAVDWNVVRQLAARTNNDIVRRLMESMVSTLAASIPKIEASQETADWSKLSGLAHQLKSSSAALGALRFSESCERVESEIDAGLAPSDERLASLLSSAQQVLEEIQARRIFK